MATASALPIRATGGETAGRAARVEPAHRGARARQFRAMHQSPNILVLANAWDVGSAALLAGLPGIRAVATTSAGVAATQGLPDGEQLSLDHVLALVEQICRAVDVPVSVDLEAGYGRSTAEVADSVASMIEVGAAGVNLEDGDPEREDRLLTADAHAERIAAARTAARQLDVPIVVNARTDVFWRGIGVPDGRFAETARRLRLYALAGADCVFVPGFPGSGVDPAQQRLMIGELVDHLGDVPLNLLAASTLLSVAELRALNVRRLSVGSALYRLGMAAVRDAMDELLSTGRQESLARAESLSYAELAQSLAAGSMGSAERADRADRAGSNHEG